MDQMNQQSINETTYEQINPIHDLSKSLVNSQLKGQALKESEHKSTDQIFVLARFGDRDLGTLKTIESGESEETKQFSKEPSRQSNDRDMVSSQRVSSYYGPQTAVLRGKETQRYDIQ